MIVRLSFGHFQFFLWLAFVLAFGLGRGTYSLLDELFCFQTFKAYQTNAISINANFVILCIFLLIFIKSAEKKKKVRNSADFSQQCGVIPLLFARCPV